jgi:hypothetical protein
LGKVINVVFRCRRVKFLHYRLGLTKSEWRNRLFERFHHSHFVEVRKKDMKKISRTRVFKIELERFRRWFFGDALEKEGYYDSLLNPAKMTFKKIRLSR